MPRVATVIPDNYESITRPVALGIIRQVAEILQIPADIRVLFPGAVEEAPLTGSTLNYVGEPSRFSYNGRFRAEITEAAVDDRIFATAVFQDENQPIFLEPKLGIKICPVYSGTEMAITFSYRAPNRVLAKRFRDDALMRTAMLRKENLHELTYHYGVPYPFLTLLQDVHTLRETVAGYGEDFSTWVSNHITQRATNITTLVGTQPQLVIAERQVCALGHFDFTAEPEPEEKDKEGGSWILRFEYRVSYDKVIAAAAQWPLVVHNQLMDAKWYSTPNASGTQIDPNRRRRAPSLSRFAFDHFTNVYTHDCERPYQPIAIPEFDDWAPATTHPFTSTVTTIMLMVDPEDPYAVMSLKELGDYNIDADILEYLKGEAPYLNRFGESAVHVALYVDDVPFDDGLITIDSDLNVRTVDPMSLRSRYHLRISLVHDLLAISPAAFERLRLAGKACLNIVSTLQWRDMKTAWIPTLIGGKHVRHADLKTIAQSLNDLRQPHKFGGEYRMLTVGNFIVTTHRSQLNADYDSQAGSSGPERSNTRPGDRTPIPGCNG